MLSPATLQFLKDLKKHNNKEWFDANRSRYQSAKADFESMVAEALRAISLFDPTVQHLTAKDCTFRINRDVRFSKNKNPYKTNMAMYISKNGKKGLDSAGYYLHVEPGGCFLAAGLWMPMAPELKKVRQEIDYCFPEFRKILQASAFKTAFTDLDRGEGTVLSRPPKGYEADNEAIEYLKLKSFVATAPIPDEWLTGRDMVRRVTTLFKKAHPFVAFLNRALEA
jgi:uncharacterized protein (TIGR02453 family)